MRLVAHAVALLALAFAVAVPEPGAFRGFGGAQCLDEGIGKYLFPFGQAGRPSWASDSFGDVGTHDFLLRRSALRGPLVTFPFGAADVAGYEKGPPVSGPA